MYNKLKTKVDNDVENKILNASGLVTTTVLNTNIGKVINKIFDSIGSVTTTVPNIRIGKVENKISYVSGLVQKGVITLKYHTLSKILFYFLL